MTHPASRLTDPDALVRALTPVLGDRITRAESVREQHGRGEGRRESYPPDIVVYPTSTEEVSRIVRAAAEVGSPVIPYGAGSSLEGHVSALHGGVCIDMTHMNRVLRTSVMDMDATVEAGVTRTQLAGELAGSGATFFIDPGADATIGGMIATAASGTTSVRYGTMRENVLGLTVVMADGRIMHTGGRAKKSSAGYDLTKLLIGSEGTLGVITEAIVRLHAMPDAIAAAVCSFESVEQAVDTVVALLQSGVPLARIELLDALTVAGLNDFLHMGLPLAPLIFLEIHAFSAAALAEQLPLVRDVVADGGGAVFATATTETDRHRLWEGRHRVYYAAVAMRPGADVLTTDACVPISALAECIRETRADLDAHGIIAPLVGHVGDGNFHLLLLTKLSDEAERARAYGVVSRLADRALRLGGTCTGEHGVGMGKIEALARQHGDALEAMGAIKMALDPRNLMNPGKILGRLGRVTA
ncbi:MAG: FAD-linked oxidase C-terminal domain-containing protein [Gemmatimonadaceae bacterium]